MDTDEQLRKEFQNLVTHEKKPSTTENQREERLILKEIKKLSIVMYAYNPSSWESEEDHECQANLDFIMTSYLKKQNKAITTTKKNHIRTTTQTVMHT